MLHGIATSLATTRRKALALAALLTIFGGVALILLTTASGGTADRLEPITVDRLDCPIQGPQADEGTGDVYVERTVFDQNVPPASADGTPVTIPPDQRTSLSEALQAYVSMVEDQHPTLEPDDFTKIGQSNQSAHFALEEDGRVVQLVSIQRQPDAGWAPSGMVGCAEL